MRLISIILMVIVSLNQAYAACDFSTDITKNPDGSFTYSRDCHLEVGRLVKTNDLKAEQIDKLEKVIELKDLAIDTQTKRVDLWQTSALKMEDRLNTIDRSNDWNKFLYFALGAGAIVLGGWAVGQVSK